MKKTIISVAAIVVLVAIGWYVIAHKSTSGTPAVDNTPVAVVNGQNITRSALNAVEAQINAQQGAATSTEAQTAVQTQALDSLIAQTLLIQAAQKAGITASTTEVDAQLASTKAQLGSQDAYNQALKAQGMTEADLKKQITDNLTIQAYLTQTLDLSSATATEAEIQSTYNQVAANQTGVPALADVHDQVEQAVIQQKQQALIDQEVAKLRAAGNVQVLI